MKAIELHDTTGKHAGWLVECPACGFGHLFDQRWTFNGDQDRPTFRASMLVYANPEATPPRGRCHSYVTDGRIQFLDDSTHALAGQTVDLPDI